LAIAGAGVCRVMPKSASFFSTVPAIVCSLCTPNSWTRLFADRAPTRKKPSAVRPLRGWRVPPMFPRGARMESRPLAIACTRVASSLAVVVTVGATLLGSASGAGPAKVEDPSALIPLAPHRAIYDLKLGQLRGKRSLEAVRGRIVYDFNGNMCDGYDL